MANLISFAQGARYKDTAEICPNCRQYMLKLDKLSPSGSLLVCLHCNYSKEREENENEIISDSHESTR